MFRKDLINRDDARYREASQRALGGFARAAASVAGGALIDVDDAVEASSSLEKAFPHIIAAWSVAHGIAHLALEDKLGFALTAKTGDFSKRLLPALLFAQWPDPA